MTTIFVFAYYSYKDPVFQSAVLAYLQVLKSPHLRFIILTWEQGQFRIDKTEKRQLREALLESNIVWHNTTWHSGRFKLLKKAFDLVKGVVLSGFLIAKYRAKTIYSEGFPGAIIGHYLSILTRTPHVIHTFEPHADYMMESGVWRKNSWEYKLLTLLEMRIAKRAERIITATRAYKEVLKSRLGRDNIAVVPSCVDTNHYKFDIRKRDEIRQDLGIHDNQIVVVYLGKVGGMYMDDEIFQFFNYCLRLKNDNFFFFLFTNEELARITCDLNRFEIPLTKVLVKHLAKPEVPAYLSAADIGFCGIRPTPSRRYSSPIKNGEYWACGLPVLVPHGISDDYVLADEYGIGFSFKEIVDIKFSVLESLKHKDRGFIQSQCYPLRSLAYHKETIGKCLRDILP